MSISFFKLFTVFLSYANAVMELICVDADTIKRCAVSKDEQDQRILLEISIVKMKCIDNDSSSSVKCIAINFDGTKCACCSKKCDVSAYCLVRKEQLWTRNLGSLTCLTIPSAGISFGRSSNILIANTDTAVFIIDGDTGELDHRLFLPNVTSACLSADCCELGVVAGRVLYMYSVSSEAVDDDVDNAQPFNSCQWSRRVQDRSGICFTEDSLSVVVAEYCLRLLILDVTSGDNIFILESDCFFTSTCNCPHVLLNFHHSNKVFHCFLCSSDANGIWDLDTGDFVPVNVRAMVPSSVSLSFNDELLAVGFHSGCILYDTSTGLQVSATQCPPCRRWSTCLAFVPSSVILM